MYFKFLIFEKLMKWGHFCNIFWGWPSYIHQFIA